MPHSIDLSNLSCSTPDGRQLFSHVSLSIGLERIGLIGRNGVGKTMLLKVIAGDLSPSSGTVSVSGRMGVLRQEVQVLGNETIADLFNARHALMVLTRAQAGAATVEELADIDWMLEASIAAALARVGLDAPLTRCSLSSPVDSAHGQHLLPRFMRRLIF